MRTRPTHVTLAVILQVRGDRLSAVDIPVDPVARVLHSALSRRESVVRSLTSAAILTALLLALLAGVTLVRRRQRRFPRPSMPPGTPSP